MISKVIYKGDLRTEAVHIQSGNVFITDAPVDNQGKGEAFSPTDLVATALASCMLTIMGIVADRNHINLDGTTAEVEKMMGTKPRRIKEIRINIMFNENFDRISRRKLESAALTCPVSNSLNKNLKETIKFIYP
ncbi:MAG: osmotically inducible protein OsmC [Candidatus Marinimicrobia bacterium]|nr:osmotically inducible protein OsmC [Candidatus Neomarinimicrobiota bacterium]|tara:strand:- start:2119 stop:2520 length:402 start_codon:yes stop_codon:yes gene_type:complete